MEAHSQQEIEWAIERKMFTERYCGEDCENPHQLDFNSCIDLKDGITSDGQMPLYLYRNPSKILKDKYLNEWFNYCRLAEGGLFPVAGGAIDQPTEFLEFYEIYTALKNIRKVQTEEKSNE